MMMKNERPHGDHAFALSAGSVAVFLVVVEWASYESGDPWHLLAVATDVG